mmetsp:Transcript_25504/g.38485  ORF Transcript_25504/g.38485 Transcript_25504/m.38485 type:complete len:111 (+) Transcript_25504:793-1125(+)
MQIWSVSGHQEYICLFQTASIRPLLAYQAQTLCDYEVDLVDVARMNKFELLQNEMIQVDSDSACRLLWTSQKNELFEHILMFLIELTAASCEPPLDQVSLAPQRHVLLAS